MRIELTPTAAPPAKPLPEPLPATTTLRICLEESVSAARTTPPPCNAALASGILKDAVTSISPLRAVASESFKSALLSLVIVAIPTLAPNPLELPTATLPAIVTIWLRSAAVIEIASAVILEPLRTAA